MKSRKVFCGGEVLIRHRNYIIIKGKRKEPVQNDKKLLFTGNGYRGILIIDHFCRKTEKWEPG